MSFVEQEDVLQVIEGCFIELTKQVGGERKLQAEPFPRLTWHETMERYGSDKPDLRYELPLQTVADLVKDCGFKVFADVVASGGTVSALRVPGGAELTRKEIDDLTELAKTHGAGGLAYIVVKEGELQSPIVKFLGDEVAQSLVDEVSAAVGDIIFFGAGLFREAVEPLGAVRQACAERFGLIDESVWSYLWVTDFPMFEESKETGQLGAMHHPFTRPHPEDVEKLATEPLAARAVAYDLVLNGVEVGGGSIRIHEQELQKKVFTALGISTEEAEARFGHMLKAFSYGAPPHGGIAMGLDRVVMLLAGEPNIREVIAFPKDQKAKDLMLGAPSEVSAAQLKELNLKISE